MTKIFQNTQPVNKASLYIQLFIPSVAQNTQPAIKVSLFLEPQTITCTLF